MTEPTDRVVIADTSSLVFAHVVDRDLLRRLYGRILVPEAVWEELEEGLREGQPGPDVPSMAWMEVRPTTLAPAVTAADANLGRGEAAVLSLALSLAPAQEAFTLLGPPGGQGSKSARLTTHRNPRSPARGQGGGTRPRSRAPDRPTHRRGNVGEGRGPSARPRWRELATARSARHFEISLELFLGRLDHRDPELTQRRQERDLR
jgi:hypothetical protein